IYVNQIYPIQISEWSLPSDITKNEFFSGQITVFNQNGPVEFDIQSGELPPGLSLDSATGIIEGTPTTGGRYTFTVRVEDDLNSSEREFTITVGPAEADVQVNTILE